MSTPTTTAEPTRPLTTPTVVNTVLDDIHAAVAAYPHTYLTVEIHDVVDVTDGGSVDSGAAAINEGNEIAFKVRVHNSGPLDVLDLTLTIEAEGGATGVKKHSDTALTSSLTSSVFPTIPGHQDDGEFVDAPEDYHFKAGAASGGKVVDLVNVWVKAWNGGFDHEMLGPSGEDTAANAPYSHKVLKN